MELLDRKVVPVVNENDTVSVDEIAFGDNDKLSALVAGCCDAELLIILSDVEGLYSNTREKQVVPVVENIDDNIRRLVIPSKGKTTVGGMASKIDAAYLAGKWGVYTIIASGHRRGILTDILLKSKSYGTLFLPSKGKKDAKKKWIAYIASSSGMVVIDNGAKNAIKNMGKSLLCSGIIEVKGNFSKGDVVDVICEGEIVARGIAGMNALDMDKMKGKRASTEAIHRNSLVTIGDK